jgi:hypothetical protein
LNRVLTVILLTQRLETVSPTVDSEIAAACASAPRRTVR